MVDTEHKLVPIDKDDEKWQNMVSTGIKGLHTH